jgi:UTP--glucose-1-phosphate uridylyltransferase
MPDKFALFEERMRAEKLPEVAIGTFRHYYTQLVNGATGLIPEKEIRPVDSLPDADSFGADLARAGTAALPKAVLI